jgi:hypothetical protein
MKYSINRSKVALGFVGMEWKQKTVAQLDAALDQWVQSIPEHRKPYSQFVFVCA